MVAMAIGILAAVLGLVLAAAAIGIPRLVARRNQPEEDADSQAYLKNTGRSVEDIVRGNRDRLARQQSDAGSDRSSLQPCAQSRRSARS
jgi:hypothetical protein